MTLLSLLAKKRECRTGSVATGAIGVDGFIGSGSIDSGSGSEVSTVSSESEIDSIGVTVDSERGTRALRPVGRLKMCIHPWSSQNLISS